MPRGMTDMITYISVLIALLTGYLFAFPDGCERDGILLDCGKSHELDINCKRSSTFGGIERLYLRTVRKLALDDFCMPDLNFVTIRQTDLTCEELIIPESVSVQINGRKCNRNQSSRSTERTSTHDVRFSTRKPIKDGKVQRPYVTTTTPIISTTVEHDPDTYISDTEDGTRNGTTDGIFSATGEFFVTSIVLISLTSLVVACVSVFGILKVREYFLNKKEQERTIRLTTFRYDTQPSVMKEVDIETLSCDSQPSLELFRVEETLKKKTA